VSLLHPDLRPFLLLIGFGLLMLNSTFAQSVRVGYFNSRDVMAKMPEYSDAKTEINQVSQEWHSTLKKDLDALKKMREDLIVKDVVLTEQEKGMMLARIYELEEKTKAFREEKFGYHGELFRLQEEKIKPIQKKVIEAAEKAAKRKRMNIIFDKAGNTTWLFTNAKYDMTDDILDALGLKDEAMEGGGRSQNDFR
jgi:outer membrane protein